MKEKVLKATTQKSYYGKAHYYEYENAVFLRSYETTVCRIINGKFERLWSGFSKTTLNHVNDFRKLYGMEPLRKRDWLSLHCDGKSYQIFITNYFTGNRSKFGPIFSDFSEADDYAFNKINSLAWYYEVEEV